MFSDLNCGLALVAAQMNLAIPIWAVAFFFEQRNEAYRFMIVGPTGSVAAQLNGSTYHSVFRIDRKSVV